MNASEQKIVKMAQEMLLAVEDRSHITPAIIQEHIDRMVNLYRLKQPAAREFMARFYLNWLDGPKPKDLSVALRETQLFFIQHKDEQFRDTRVWAPFVLIEGRGL